MIELIPAIDLIEGQCVRLCQGDYDQCKVYSHDPLEVALRLEDHGLRRLHMVDLDGAASSHVVNWRILEKVASRTRLVIDFGGGIKSDEDLDVAFSSGAAMVTGGSVAVEDSQLFLSWLQAWGADRLILGADFRDGMVATHGWRKTSSEALLPFLERYHAKGVTKCICTDVGRDGMLGGPSLEVYRTVLEKIPSLGLVASGGVSSMDDILRLEEAGLGGVIFGKALYEGKITLEQLEHHIIGGH